VHLPKIKTKTVQKNRYRHNNVSHLSLQTKMQRQLCPKKHTQKNNKDSDLKYAILWYACGSCDPHKNFIVRFEKGNVPTFNVSVSDAPQNLADAANPIPEH
jgi:uncharacterized protein YjaZ